MIPKVVRQVKGGCWLLRSTLTLGPRGLIDGGHVEDVEKRARLRDISTTHGKSRSWAYTVGKPELIDYLVCIPLPTRKLLVRTPCIFGVLAIRIGLLLCLCSEIDGQEGSVHRTEPAGIQRRLIESSHPAG